MAKLTLKGYLRVSKQLASFAQFREKALRAATKAQPAMESQARSDVLEVVYSAPENPDYERSGNMAASTDVVVVSDVDSVTTDVMLNPEKATKPFSYTYAGNTAPSGLRSFYDLIGRAGKMWYPAYVAIGTFFRKTGAPRDYRAKWRETLIPRYISGMGKALRGLR